jgi:hypothetical protein
VQKLSALGQERTSPRLLSNVRFAPKADIANLPRYVRFVPQADIRIAAKPPLLNYLVGTQQERLGHGEAKGLSSRQINDEIELCRLLDREDGRLRAAQNLVDVVRGTSEQVRDIWVFTYLRWTHPFNAFSLTGSSLTSL